MITHFLDLASLRAAVTDAIAGLRSAVAPPTGPDDAACVDRLWIGVDVRCPCGSEIVHRLGALHEAADCRRCNRRFAIGSLHYGRPAQPGLRPALAVVLVYLDVDV